MAAASVGLPIALVSIAKLFLFVGGAAILLSQKPVADPEHAHRNVRWTAFAVLLVLAAFTASLGWTTASGSSAFGSLAKYGKLLTIPLIALLIQSRREATIALAAFAAAQVFTILSTWMLVAHLPVPWATSPTAMVFKTTFSSYLDQSIMTGVFAAICWHLKAYAPVRYRTTLAMGICALALSCVFFIFQGRTGHVVAIALITLALLWEIPKRRRVGVAAIPVLLVIVLAMNSGKGNHGLAEIGNGIAAFSTTGDASGSSGIRLDLWRRSLQSISENPVWGSGAGSWSRELNRQQNLRTPVFPPRITANPHQEYLLWGIELGVPGIALLCAVLAALWIWP